MRHMHIAEAIDWVVKEFNNFIKTNKAAGISKGERVSSYKILVPTVVLNLTQARDVKDITEAVKQLPQVKFTTGHN